MESVNLAAVLGFFGLLGAGISVWVSLRERLVRAETKIETLEKLHADQKTEVGQLREWLDAQFHELRKVLAMKADR